MAAETRPQTVREQFILRAMTSCRHFRGIFHNETCKAGVNYRVLAGEPEADYGARLPCTGVRFRDDVEPVECAQRAVMNRDEAEKDADEHLARMERFGVAHKAAKDHAKTIGLRKGHGGYGELLCPVCDGGTLRYSVASVNGHMHGQCSTKGCVSWME